MTTEMMWRPDHGRLERCLILGNKLLDQGKATEALEMTTRVLAWEPQDLGARRLREDALEALGQLEQGLRHGH